MEQKSPASYVAEFLGTFFLVFAISLVVCLFVNPQGTGTDWAVVGLVHGFVLFLIVATLGYVSGAHVNPAVTIAAMALRTIKVSDGIVYILLQLAGAVAGALMTKFILLDDLADQQNVGAVSLNFSLISNSFAGVVAEGIGTFLLVWAVIGVAMNPRANRAWAPLVIGTTLGFAVMIHGAADRRRAEPGALVRPRAGRQRVGRLLGLDHRPVGRSPAGGGQLLVPVRGRAARVDDPRRPARPGHRPGLSGRHVEALEGRAVTPGP